MPNNHQTSALSTSTFATLVGAPEQHSVPVAFDLDTVIRSLLDDIEGVAALRILDRPGCPKLFVITSTKSFGRDREIIRRLVQIEDIRSDEFLNYDIVPSDRAHLVPSDARPVR